MSLFTPDAKSFLKLSTHSTLTQMKKTTPYQTLTQTMMARQTLMATTMEMTCLASKMQMVTFATPSRAEFKFISYSSCFGCCQTRSFWLPKYKLDGWYLSHASTTICANSQPRSQDEGPPDLDGGGDGEEDDDEEEVIPTQKLLLLILLPQP